MLHAVLALKRCSLNQGSEEWLRNLRRRPQRIEWPIVDDQFAAFFNGKQQFIQ